MRKRFHGGFIVRPSPSHDGTYVIYCKAKTVDAFASKKVALDAPRDLGAIADVHLS